MVVFDDRVDRLEDRLLCVRIESPHEFALPDDVALCGGFAFGGLEVAEISVPTKVSPPVPRSGESHQLRKLALGQSQAQPLERVGVLQVQEVDVQLETRERPGARRLPELFLLLVHSFFSASGFLLLVAVVSRMTLPRSHEGLKWKCVATFGNSEARSPQ